MNETQSETHRMFALKVTLKRDAHYCFLHQGFVEILHSQIEICLIVDILLVVLNQLILVLVFELCSL